MKQFILIFQTILISSIVFGQNTNPYKVFGCNTNANYEIPISCLFRVNNNDSKSNIKALAIDFDKSLAYLLGGNDSIIKTLNIDPEEVLIWLSTDPKSDKYPSQSPYHYCSNNPIMRVDPNGMSDDWFMNDKTGDVYYNSAYRAKDASKIDGSNNWAWMGENGMFGANPNGYNNVTTIGPAGSNTSASNAISADLTQLLNNPLVSGGSWTSGGNYSANITGNNAQTFMSNQGYNYVPQDYIYNMNILTQSIPEPHQPIQIVTNNSSIIPLTNQYVPKNHIKTTTTLETRVPITTSFPGAGLMLERGQTRNRDTYRRGVNSGTVNNALKIIQYGLDLWNGRK